MCISVQFSRSVVSNSLWPHGLQHARLPCPSPTPGDYSNSCPSLWVMPSNHLILCHSPLLLPSIFPSIRVFSNELVLHIRWPKCGSFSFSISPSNEYSGLNIYIVCIYTYLSIYIFLHIHTYVSLVRSDVPNDQCLQSQRKHKWTWMP